MKQSAGPQKGHYCLHWTTLNLRVSVKFIPKTFLNDQEVQKNTGMLLGLKYHSCSAIFHKRPNSKTKHREESEIYMITDSILHSPRIFRGTNHNFLIPAGVGIFCGRQRHPNSRFPWKRSWDLKFCALENELFIVLTSRLAIRILWRWIVRWRPTGVPFEGCVGLCHVTKRCPSRNDAQETLSPRGDIRLKWEIEAKFNLIFTSWQELSKGLQLFVLQKSTLRRISDRFLFPQPTVWVPGGEKCWGLRMPPPASIWLSRTTTPLCPSVHRRNLVHKLPGYYGCAKPTLL